VAKCPTWHLTASLPRLPRAFLLASCQSRGLAQPSAVEKVDGWIRHANNTCRGSLKRSL